MSAIKIDIFGLSSILACCGKAGTSTAGMTSIEPFNKNASLFFRFVNSLNGIFKPESSSSNRMSSTKYSELLNDLKRFLMAV